MKPKPRGPRSRNLVTRGVRCVLGIVVVLTALRTAGDADAQEYGTGTLRGLRTVVVTPDLRGAAMHLAGLSEENLRADVELRLRNAGLRVVRHAESPAVALMLVRIDGTSSNGEADSTPGQLRLVSRVAVHQPARLTRDNDIIVVGTTWEDLRFTDGPPTRASAEQVRAGVGDSVDVFLTAWLAQNPEMPGPQRDGGGK